MGNAIQATNKLQKLLRLWKKDALARGRATNVEVQIVRELCKVGADLNYLEIERGFALIPNVFWSRELIYFFVHEGMNVNSRDEKGDTALHLVIRHANNVISVNERTDAIQVIEFLLYQCGADPNVANLRGETALFAVAKCLGTEISYSPQSPKFWDPFKRESMRKVAEMLVDRGANLTTRNCDGESILHKCIYDINSRFIRVFEEGVDVRTSSWLFSKTPLMAAAIRGINDLDCLKNCRLLIERGADVNAVDLQGYTALHHAVLNGAYECAQFLISMGADRNARSTSGRDIYDMNILRPAIICNEGVPLFTQGATPTKLVQILEIVGALKIMKVMFNKGGAIGAIKLWDLAMENYRKFDLQISPEFLDNYQLLRENINNPNRNEEIALSAMNTVDRLSSENNKFWNLFSVPIVRNNWYVFNILNLLSEELKRVEDFASIEEIDFYSLLDLVEFFSDWLKKLVQSGSKNEVTPQPISNVHSIARLSIACFDKLTHATNSKKVSDTCTKLYVKLCHLLTSLHSNFADVIRESEFNENKILLNKLIELDLRDGDSNSLMHLVLGYDGCKFETELLRALLDDFELGDFTTTKNRGGYEPIQIIKHRMSPDVLAKMGDRGAHIDARHCRGLRDLRGFFERTGRPDLTFRYDTLQCACARVLVKSLVPNWNRMPKHIVDFISMHIK